MEKNEVVDILKYHIKKTNNVEDIEAFTQAIKCMELLPVMVGCIAMARDTCDACQYPNLAKEYKRVIKKAKELIE